MIFFAIITAIAAYYIPKHVQSKGRDGMGWRLAIIIPSAAQWLVPYLWGTGTFISFVACVLAFTVKPRIARRRTIRPEAA